jgi:sugar lactone lactonase YvrE
MASIFPAMAYGGTTAPTIANNTFASTPVGQSLTQTVTLTLTSATAIKSIALATGTSASSEYTLKSVSGCTVDGTTVNASGAVCSLTVKYTPLSPGSLASPTLSRNAQLLYTDGASNVTAYGLSGAATKAVGHVVPGTISLYAGLPYTATGTSPLDNGLGQVNGGYAGTGVAATSAEFQFSTYNAILTENIPSNGSQPLALDSQGNLYVIDGANFVIRKIDNSSTHVVTTIAGTPSAQGYTGNGGAATSAKLNNPRGLTLDAAGNIYFLDQTTSSFYIYPAYVIRRIDAVTGIITAVAGENFTGTYDSTDGGGTCDLSNSSAYAVYQCGDGGLATYAFLNNPNNLALDSEGNFYLWGGKYGFPPYVRKITASTGTISNIGNETNLNSTYVFGGMTLGSDGNVYVLVIDQTSDQVQIKQLNPTTQAVTTLAGSNEVYSGCAYPAAQQKGFPAANLSLAPGTVANLGDLSSDASGNVYVNDDLCSSGAISSYNFPPSIVRVNIASATAYDEVVANGYLYGATQSIGYNAFYFYGIFPVSAIPDNAGNIFFTSWNQIAELSGQNAELDFTEREDFTTSAAQTATYANLGNESGAAPTYTFHSGTNFVVLDSGDTNACDAITSVAEGGACDLDLAFAPIVVGPLTDTLNVSGSGSTERVTVDGIGDAAAQLGVSPATLAFGNQALGVASAPQTVTISDTGTANLTVYSFFADGTNGPANYEIASGGTCSTTTSTALTPGQSCTIQVIFTPSALGSLPASLNLNTSLGESDVVSFTGTGVPAGANVTETGNLFFNPAPVAIAAASAQTLTATFTITGESSLITPTAKMNYGLAYKVGKVACTGSAGNQTCTVPVTFIPNLPGGHRDALFLMNGTTRLASELAYGVGQSGLALVQPGNLIQSADQGAYLYASVVADDGTVYILTQSGTVLSRSTAGVFTTLPITGLNSPRTIALDGAGILYIADQTYNGPLITYDTVLGVQGTLPYPMPNPGYIQTATVDNTGTVYMADYSNIYVFAPGAAQTTIAINPGIDQADAVAVDSANNLFIGGGSVNELTSGGTQTQVNSTFPVGPFYTDAADTLYLPGTGRGIEEFPASDYTTSVGNIDAADSSIGVSVGPDGTAYIGNYGVLDEVDRSQESIDFGFQSTGSAATPQTIQIYNGGNENLTISKIALTGSSTFSTTQPTNPCTNGKVLAAGTLCNLTVNFLSQVPGSFSGALTFTTNSLNTTSNTVVTLAARINGAYMVPSPTSLDFGSVTEGTTSATKTITLTNQGYGVAAEVYSPASTDPGFTVTLGTCTNVNVAVGDSCQLNVTFSPTAVQAYSATGSADVTNAGPGGAPPVSFTLTGTGTPSTPPPPPAVANLQFAPATVNLLAGDFTAAYTGDNGPATSATLNRPFGIAYDAAGNLYIADSKNFVIRKVDTAGKISTFAGNGTQWVSGSDGDNGPALSAEFSNPEGVAVDASGNVYVADRDENVVRKIDTTGTITLFAGSSNGYSGYGGDGGPATSATLDEPIGIAFDPTGNLYIADSLNEVVRQVDTSGNIHTFAGTGAPGYSGDGGAATSAKLQRPIGVAADAAGNIYIADNDNYVFRVVNSSKVISTFAGTGTLGNTCPAGSAPTTCTFASAAAIVASPSGDIYLSDAQSGSIFVVDNAGKTYPVEQAGLTYLFIGGSDISEGTAGPDFFAIDPNGQLIVSNYEGNVVTSAGSTGILSFTHQTVGTTSAAMFIQLINPGAAALTFSEAPTVTGPYAISGGTCDFTKGLAAGADCTIGVTFTPTVDGPTILGSIVLKSNATTSPSTIQITGNAVGGPVALLSPTTISFPNTATGSTSAAISATLSNTGDSVLNISSITLSDTTDFAETTGCGSTLAAGLSCSISVTFKPGSAAAFTGTLSVADDGTQSPQTVTLTGTGTAATAPVASLSPTTLTFPSTTVGSTATKLSTTLSNTGNATLNISGITLTGANPTDFAETTNCGSTLAAGKSCMISATFTPAAVASYTATISVADNATGSPQTVALSGAGTGGVSASPTSLNMGSQTEYTENYTPQYVTLTNNTSSTVTFSNFQSADPSEFNSQAYTCSDGGVLLGNSSCQISVRFSPLSVGVINSSITMPYTGAGGGTLVVQLTGTGTVGTPAVALYPASAVFETVPVGTAAVTQSIQVESTGTAPLTGIGVSLSGANAGDFTQTNNCAGVTIDPNGNTCLITLNFTPSAAGLRSATVNVTANGGAATASAPISGAGVAQVAQVQFSPAQLNLFAGGGTACADAIAGGKANVATLCNVQGAAQDYLGNTYLVDTTYNVVYKVDTSGNLSVFAGTPSKTGGYYGDYGPATQATLSGPTAVAVDAYGDVFISDTGNAAIREVDNTGTMTSFVNSSCDEGGHGTPMGRRAAAKAGAPRRHTVELCEATSQPEGLVVDSHGNLIFADTANNVVIAVDILAQIPNIIAGEAAEGFKGTAGYNGDNIQAEVAELNAPQDVAVDPAGNIYIADTLNYRVRKVTASTGVITTVAGDGTMGNTGADGSAATSAEITPFGVSSDLSGDLFISSGSGGLVRKVDASGNISNFAGNGTGAIGGPASTGAVANAWFARTDNNGSLLIPTGLQVLLAGPDGLLQFGSQANGTTSAALDVTIENTGDASLQLDSTVGTFTGTDAADFALSGGNCGSTLLPGKTCTASVTFKPAATGARTASLSVPTNAAGTPQTVLLQGTGSTAAAAVASLSPTTLAFPSTTVGSTATKLSTTLSNTGNATLNISGITLTGANPGDFAETTTCGSTLAAGKTCTISVTFTPAAVASYAATLSVADDAAGSPQTVALSGTGTAAPAPIASLTPGSLTFANTVQGSTTAAQTLTLSNTGNAPLSITGITLGGTNPADFAETTTCGSTLAAGSSCPISVTFTPATVASFTATVSVADNAAGSPQTATLAGTGLAPPDFTVSSSVPSQAVQPGAAAQYPIAVTATGGDFTGAVVLTATGLPPGAIATFAPASVTPDSGSVPSLLTIQTSSGQAAAKSRWPWRPVTGPLTALAFCVPLLWWRRRSRLRSVGLLCALLSVTAMFATGCGGGYYLNTSKTYTVTVTGTSGSSQHSTTVTLTIQ